MDQNRKYDYLPRFLLRNNPIAVIKRTAPDAGSGIAIIPCRSKIENDKEPGSAPFDNPVSNRMLSTSVKSIAAFEAINEL